MGVKIIPLNPEPVRTAGVIGVHNGDVPPLRFHQASVSRFCRLLVAVISQNVYPVVSFLPFQYSFIGSVCTAIITDQQLPILHILPDNGRNCQIQNGWISHIKGRHENGDQGLIVSHTSVHSSSDTLR